MEALLQYASDSEVDEKPRERVWSGRNVRTEPTTTSDSDDSKEGRLYQTTGSTDVQTGATALALESSVVKKTLEADLEISATQLPSQVLTPLSSLIRKACCPVHMNP